MKAQCTTSTISQAFQNLLLTRVNVRRFIIVGRKRMGKCDPKLDNSHTVVCNTCVLAYISLAEEIGLKVAQNSFQHLYLDGSL